MFCMKSLFWQSQCVFVSSEACVLTDTKLIAPPIIISGYSPPIWNASNLDPTNNFWMCKKPADVKGKVFPLHSMRAYRGRRCVAPLVRISALKRWEVHFIPRLLYQGGKSAGYRCNRGWVVPEPVWTVWWREKCLAPAAFEHRIGQQ